MCYNIKKINKKYIFHEIYYQSEIFTLLTLYIYIYVATYLDLIDF